MLEIRTGITGKAAEEATGGKLASAMGSGSLDVYATPAMVALMENAACAAIAEYLEEGETTVGTEMNVKHISATPAGMKVTAEAEVTEVNGREIVFTVKACDEAGVIGDGTHKRFLVTADRFMAKTNSKKA